MVEPLDNQTLFRRTVVTVAAMVGSCALVVGSLTLIALAVSGRAAASNADAVPAANVHGALPAPRQPAGGSTPR